MRIAYLTNQYPKVSHTFIRTEIRELETHGLQVSRVSLRGTPDRLVDPADVEEERLTEVILAQSKLLLVLRALGVAISHPWRFLRALQMALRLGRRSERGLFRNLSYLVSACALLRITQRERAGHVHAHFGTNPAAVALLCHLLGGPSYSFTAHGPEEFDKTWSLCLRDKIAHARFVAGVSSFGRSQLYRHCDAAHWSKIKVVHCAIGQGFVEVTPEPVAANGTFVCVGRLCEQKGQLLLVEAVARLCKEGVKLKLVLVGDGEMRAEVEEAVRVHGLQGVVEITGWASACEVQEQLNGACAFVLPSFAEGLPVVIMEAMALQRPVLSTYIAGIPELVRHEENGWLVPAGSVEALTMTMRSVLQTDAATLQRMGEAGRQRVLARHRSSIAVKPLLELYQAGETGA